MRVCQFRHDGKNTGRRPSRAIRQEETTANILQAAAGCYQIYAANVAVMVMSAFNTFETGHPLLALSASF